MALVLQHVEGRYRAAERYYITALRLCPRNACILHNFAGVIRLLRVAQCFSTSAKKRELVCSILPNAEFLRERHRLGLHPDPGPPLTIAKRGEAIALPGAGSSPLAVSCQLSSAACIVRRVCGMSLIPSSCWSRCVFLSAWP